MQPPPSAAPAAGPPPPAGHGGWMGDGSSQLWHWNLPGRAVVTAAPSWPGEAAPGPALNTARSTQRPWQSRRPGRAPGPRRPARSARAPRCALRCAPAGWHALPSCLRAGSQGVAGGSTGCAEGPAIERQAAGCAPQLASPSLAAGNVHSPAPTGAPAPPAAQRAARRRRAPAACAPAPPPAAAAPAQLAPRRLLR